MSDFLDDFLDGLSNACGSDLCEECQSSDCQCGCHDDEEPS